MGKGFRLGLPLRRRPDRLSVCFDEARPHEGSDVAGLCFYRVTKPTDARSLKKYTELVNN